MITIITRGEAAYREIKAGILSYRWPPGTKLAENDLSGQLGLSRTPVREAFNRLESEGLVERVAGWGVFVKKLEQKEILEMYEVREALEGIAAVLIVERATPADLAVLRQTVEKMDRALNKKGGADVKAYHRADNEFHSLLVQASHNQKLIELASLGRMKVAELPGYKQRGAETKRRKTLLEHKEILTHLKNGAGKSAEKIVRKHISRAKKETEKFFLSKNNRIAAKPGRSRGR